MRAKQMVIGLFSIGAVLTTAAACSRTNELGGELAPANIITVHVRNNNFLDMDVYAVSEGLSTRLGTVTGNSSRDFAADASMATQNFRIVATPIGGNGRASSGTILVSPGQTVDFTIGSLLQNSTAVIR
jgi:hypothetical protein